MKRTALRTGKVPVVPTRPARDLPLDPLADSFEGCIDEDWIDYDDEREQWMSSCTDRAAP